MPEMPEMKQPPEIPFWDRHPWATCPGCGNRIVLRKLVNGDYTIWEHWAESNLYPHVDNVYKAYCPGTNAIAVPENESFHE